MSRCELAVPNRRTPSWLSAKRKPRKSELKFCIPTRKVDEVEVGADDRQALLEESLFDGEARVAAQRVEGVERVVGEEVEVGDRRHAHGPALGLEGAGAAEDFGAHDEVLVGEELLAAPARGDDARVDGRGALEVEVEEGVVAVDGIVALEDVLVVGVEGAALDPGRLLLFPVVAVVARKGEAPAVGHRDELFARGVLCLDRAAARRCPEATSRAEGTARASARPSAHRRVVPLRPCRRATAAARASAWESRRAWASAAAARARRRSRGATQGASRPARPSTAARPIRLRCWRRPRAARPGAAGGARGRAPRNASGVRGCVLASVSSESPRRRP